MKKTLLALSIMIILTSGVAFAATYKGTMTIGGSGDNPELSMGLSNEVRATYAEDGGGDPAQWYTIATYHIGGTRVFGTAQDITSIYYLDKDSGGEFEWTGMPADGTDSEVWSEDVWKRL